MIIIYDNSSYAHGIRVQSGKARVVELPEELLKLDDSTTAIMIHTSEAKVENVLPQLLQRYFVPIILFSGGGFEEPERLRQQYQPVGEQRIWAYTAAEAVRRLSRAMKDGAGRLIERDRLEVALEVLESLWVLHLKLEMEGKLTWTEQKESVELFLSIDRSGNPHPVNPWKPDAVLSALDISEILQNAADAELYCKQLEAIRDVLLDWAE